MAIFRKGLNLKSEVADDLTRDYHSQLVDRVKAEGHSLKSGRLTIHLAKEFGFCYGVDRAVDYAYQTRKRFPDKRVFLTGEIIHNPHVNMRLRESGIRFLTDPEESIKELKDEDIVILPAFGVPVGELEELCNRGCTLIDTTCGSVLNVWKNVQRYARDGFSAIIHGKAHHEETRATASQAINIKNGHYLIILDREEAELVCKYIRGTFSGTRLMEHFKHSCSKGFNPERDLIRVGLANQTTMLMSESLALGEMIRDAMIDRHGIESLSKHYRAFETICSATQDRQDAIQVLLKKQSFSFAVVIGGYNSSNTKNLARICAEHVTTYHIADSLCLVSESELHCRATEAASKVVHSDMLINNWLPTTGPIAIALTAGASTPDNIVGEVIEKLIACVNT